MNAPNWFCIQTKPGQEEGVVKLLQTLPDLEVFNPKIKGRRFLRGRFREVVEGLFPGYLFIRFELPRYYRKIRYTRGVQRIVGSPLGDPYRVDEGIISSIKEREEGGFIRLDPPELNPGDRVYIREGPFRGFSGIFQGTLRPSERVMILLDTISYQPKVETQREYLSLIAN